MQSAVLDKLREERDQVRSAATAIAEGENFNPEDENYVDLKTRATKLDGRIKELADLLQQQSAADTLDATLSKAARHREQQHRAEQERHQLQTAETPGDLFTRSEQFEHYSHSPVGTSGRLQIDDVFDPRLQTRAPLTTSDFSDVMLPTQRVVEELPLRLRIFDVITVVPVTTGSVEIVKWVFNSEADDVPEGELKPESSLDATVEPLALKTQAHWIELTRQLLEDVPAMRSRVDNGLLNGVLKRMARNAMSVVLAGTGYTTLYEVDSVLAGIRQAIGMLDGVGDDETAGFTPNSVFLNPADLADMDMAVFNVTGNPTMGQPFWGLTPIPWNTIPAGTAYVGDFQAAVEHYRRTNATVYITDSHAENFTSNIFTLLGEGRSATALVRPDAIVKVTTGEEPEGRLGG